ncbi:SHUGOSHIN 2-like [Musa acuminata AAA Group]|uniref:SHUGOSHIN 2-like n=1 Tax=Musa acuminata AAA Group TaxID=214697 RepID=UPI0031DC43DD
MLFSLHDQYEFQENTALLKLLAEKNKIIELSSTELQKLQFELRKTSQQNWQLARANSHMLAELNLGKERVCFLYILFSLHNQYEFQENTALLKLHAEKNKIIELSSTELQKLQFELRKTSQQNWQLARANSHMLAELNLGKERLKVLTT